MESMLPTMNTDGGIDSDVILKADRTETLTVARGLLPLDCGQEISWMRWFPFLVLVMVRKAVIGRVAEEVGTDPMRWMGIGP